MTPRRCCCLERFRPGDGRWGQCPGQRHWHIGQPKRRQSGLQWCLGEWCLGELGEWSRWRRWQPGPEQTPPRERRRPKRPPGMPRFGTVPGRSAPWAIGTRAGAREGNGSGGNVRVSGTSLLLAWPGKRGQHRFSYVGCRLRSHARQVMSVIPRWWHPEWDGPPTGCRCRSGTTANRRQDETTCWFQTLYENSAATCRCAGTGTISTDCLRVVTG